MEEDNRRVSIWDDYMLEQSFSLKLVKEILQIILQPTRTSWWGCETI